MDFNALPFDDFKNLDSYEVADIYIEFGEEPKLRVHRYREKPRPFLSYWFAVTSEWFPEDKYLSFDVRKVFNEPELQLPFNSEDKLNAIGELVTERFSSQIEFLKRVCESKLEPEPEIDLCTTFAEPLTFDTKSSEHSDNQTIAASVGSVEWNAMQPVSQQLVSLFYQTENMEDFVLCCKSIDIQLDETHLKVFWECLGEVYRSENALLQIANKEES